MPIDISLMVGDAVHNSRSALDIMLCDIARMRGIKNLSRIGFPIRESKEEFGKYIRGKNSEALKKIGKDVCDEIYKIHGDQELLYILRRMSKLDNEDKHQIVIPAVAGAAFEMNKSLLHPFELVFPAPLIIYFSEDRMLQIKKEIEDGLPEDPLKGKMIIRYCFDNIENGFYTDRWSGHVVEALREFNNATGQIIDYFDHKFQVKK